LKQRAIAIVGGKKVGKTTTSENLIAELVKRRYKVAAIKHISEPEWTIDTPGKDTYRFAQKGAKTLVVLAPNELVTIEKGKTEGISLSKLLSRAKGNDLVLIEGLKTTVATKGNISKIVVVTSQLEAESALKTYRPILAFSGPFNTETLTPIIPYVNALTEPARLADIVEKHVLKNS
jgi:molybdopterin-guanine dinucleotide biosynthesis adapter protein